MNVYDFDETLYAGESCVDFALFFIKKDPSVLRHLPDVFITFAKYKRQKITFDYFINNYGKMFKDYFATHDVDLKKIMPEFWTEKRLKNKLRPFYKSLHREDDVVISASPVFLICPACERLGIKHIIGTGFDTETGEIGKPCFRESKIDRFYEYCGEGAVIDDFYTDSMNDQFLMTLAKRVFLVKGEKITQIK
ncbi:MAG: haloacid dehalogenase-like hydrolase [Clostridia bacterium]|nr:haloacid dehalogenase-like hydrolase [Clostridia bacterium]